MDFLRETKKLYINLKQLGVLSDIEIDMDKRTISYSLKNERYHKLYAEMCCDLKNTVKFNHPNIRVNCNPPEGCQNKRHDLRRKINIEVDKNITNDERKQETIYKALVDFNGILRDIIKYGKKNRD